MTTPREAMYYEALPDGRVLCTLCPHDCRIVEGSRGACAVRVNHAGRLYTLVADRVVARQLDPIEKKPLFHFLPGSTTYSIAAPGCNLKCRHCQNWHISQWPAEHLPRLLPDESDDRSARGPTPVERVERMIPGEEVDPGEIVAAAVACGARSISYTYTEPTVFYEMALNTARAAHRAGLRNVFVTSAFINEAPLREIAPLLDAANIDLKFFRDQSYRRTSRIGLAPVLKALRLYHELGVWIEATTLIIPWLNDSDDELRRMAEFIASISPSVPWHLSRFFPAHEMRDRPPTPLETLHRAREIGAAAGLKYVYEGNVPGGGGEDTHCPGCGTRLIGRRGYEIREYRLRGARCPECGTAVEGIGLDGAAPAGSAPTLQGR